MEGIQDNLPF